MGTAEFSFRSTFIYPLCILKVSSSAGAGWISGMILTLASQRLDSMIERLALQGVEYIISTVSVTASPAQLLPLPVEWLTMLGLLDFKLRHFTPLVYTVV